MKLKKVAFVISLGWTYCLARFLLWLMIDITDKLLYGKSWNEKETQHGK